MKASDPGTLRSLVENALPQRRLALKRDELVERLCDRIRTWLELNRRLEENAKRGDQLQVIAKELMPALEIAAAKLRKLGAHRSAEERLMAPGLRAQEFAQFADAVGPFATDDWLLHLAVANAIKEVEGYTVARPGRPMDFSAVLAGELDRILRESGCSKFQREYFFARLNDSKTLPHLSPEASRETSRKRAQRGTWSPAEREFFRSSRPRRKPTEKGSSARRRTN